MQLPVVVVNGTNNFVGIPSRFCQNIRASFPQKSHGVVALRIGWLGPPNNSSGGLARPSQSFVGWTSQVADGHFLQVPVALAESIGLKDAVDFATKTAPDSPLVVSVAVIPYAPVASRVDVDPVTADDWEILQLHANFVESELLSQICVLGPGQQFPMWIHGRTRINLQVSSIALVEKGQALCVRLARNTEVVVAPKLRTKEEQYKAQNLRQKELKRSKSACAYELRIQNVPTELENTIVAPEEGITLREELEEDWNGCGVIHPSTFKRLCSSTNWPNMKVLPSGVIVYEDDPTRTVIVIVSNRQRARICCTLKNNRKVVLKQERSFVSAMNQSMVKLCVSQLAAPGHLVLSKPTQVRCKMSTLGMAVISLPRFEPVHEESSGSPPLSILLTPVMGTDEAVRCDAVADSQFVVDASLAVHEWQKRLAPRDGTLSARSKPIPLGDTPLYDGMLLAFSVTGTNGISKNGKKLVYFAVNIPDDEGHQPPTVDPKTKKLQKKKRPLEPVYWLINSNSRVEWQIAKTIVDVSGQRVMVGCGPQSHYLDTCEEMKSTCSQGDVPTGVRKVLAADGIRSYNAGYYAHQPLCKLGAVETYAKDVMERLYPVLHNDGTESRLKLGAPHPGGVYLCGGKGSGKTSLAQAIAREYRCDVNCLVHTVWVSCALLRGGKRSEVESTISTAFGEALSRAPSLIVFDDLDLLLPAQTGGENVQGGEDGQLIWLAEWLEDLLHQYQNKLECFEKSECTVRASCDGRQLTHRSISWLATGRGKGSIRSSLLRSGLFYKTVEIQPLTAHCRTVVIDALLKMKRCEGAREHPLDLEEVAAKAEGYAPADLDTLTERALHCAMQRCIGMVSSGAVVEESLDDDGVKVLTQDDFMKALDGYTPASLRGVALAKSTVNWSDVGGLHVVRRVLKETLELPIQFAPLYERSPQRLASGILLYGPPGCGKTLLAGAVAKECGLNFISVKGPEVLNKYIGASEQAIRDLFARGAAAAPCVLFFDEFDAVAPRRGNDSSGVTDRVVNQLLTFLDGVETRSGVYVMAATSRPDLVDPALLRPGRLDKQLLCGFPNAPERSDIMRTIAKKMEFEHSALEDLDRIAALPEAELFTGADLQAILYSAQLCAIHEQIPGEKNLSREQPSDLGRATASLNPKSVPEQTTSVSPSVCKSNTITKQHLYDALSDARPSVSGEDRARYNRIYEAFKGGRGADFNAVSGYPDGKQRTALK